MPNPNETIKSFDARVWARDFVEHVKANPSIAADEETMTTWFASALMRGHDEHYWSTDEYKQAVKEALAQ